MLGTKIYKKDFTDDKKFDDKKYYECSLWCDENNATIKEFDEYYEVVEKETDEKQSLKSEMYRLKNYLKSTDWIVTKCIELGLSVSETYPEEYEKRVKSRERINEIESLLNV